MPTESGVIETEGSPDRTIVHAPYIQSIFGSMEDHWPVSLSKFQFHPLTGSALVPSVTSRWEANLESHNKTSMDGLGAT